MYYRKCNNDKLITYSDADWARDATDRRSISGSATLCNDCLINWFSRKQNCVAQSTAEAEHIVAAISSSEHVNIKRICENDLNKNKFNASHRQPKCHKYNKIK